MAKDNNKDPFAEVRSLLPRGEGFWEEFNRFADAVGVSATCGACGSEKWSAVSMPPNEALFPAYLARTVSMDEPKKPANLTMTIPMAHLMCANCGLMRMHNLEMMMDWLRRQCEGGEK